MKYSPIMKHWFKNQCFSNCQLILTSTEKAEVWRKEYMEGYMLDFQT